MKCEVCGLDVDERNLVEFSLSEGYQGKCCLMPCSRLVDEYEAEGDVEALPRGPLRRNIRYNSELVAGRMMLMHLHRLWKMEGRLEFFIDPKDQGYKARASCDAPNAQPTQRLQVEDKNMIRAVERLLELVDGSRQLLN